MLIKHHQLKKIQILSMHIIFVLLCSIIQAGKNDELKIKNEKLEILRAALKQEGYGPKLNYTQGRYIELPQTKYKYLSLPHEAFPYKWNFDDGSKCSIGKTKGLANLCVKDGKLIFKTTGSDDTEKIDDILEDKKEQTKKVKSDNHESFLSWGNWSPEEAPLRIGYDIRSQTRHYKYPAVSKLAVRMRIRQSLPQSEWQAAIKTSPTANVYAANCENPKRVITGKSKKVIIKGTDWQTVLLEIPYTRSKTKVRLQPPYDAVKISTTTHGNKVEIDWVDLAISQARLQFRKVINLPAKVRWAKMSVSAYCDYRVLINGKRAAPDHYPAVMFPQLWNHEIDPKLFCKGENVIALDCPVWTRNGNSILLDGALLCEDGTYIRFDTNESWKGSQWNENHSWLKTGFNDKDWKNVILTEKFIKRDLFSFWFNPSYKGRIMVSPLDKRIQPVYGSKEPVSLLISIPKSTDSSPKVSYQIYDEMGDYFHVSEKLIVEGNLSLQQNGKDWTGKLELPKDKLLPGNAYAVYISLEISGKIIATRRYEIAVCGSLKLPEIKNPQKYTDGMKLKLVWKNDAINKQTQDKFLCCDFRGRPIDSSKAKVVKTALGKWRQSPPRQNALLSFKYNIENPGRPHVASAEYPADSFRCQSMRLEDCFPELAIPGRLRVGLPIMQLGNDGYQLGGYNPLTNTVNEHHVLFFPNKKEGMISFFTWLPKSCLWNSRAKSDREVAVRVRNIRIYEIQNDVPAKIMPKPSGDYKYFGQQSERGPTEIVQSCFQNPTAAYFKNIAYANIPYFYRNWLVSFINLVKRMRFEGTNTHYLGQFMYSSVLLPSKWSYGTQFSFNMSGTLRDYGVLMARELEENGMGWFSCLEMFGLPCFIPRYSDEEIRRGADTLAQITKEGKKVRSFTTCGQNVIVPNWIRPEVKKAYQGFIDELIALYGKEKGWKGIYLSINEALGPVWLTLKGPYWASYDDYTVNLFEKETGVKIPVDLKDHKRFSKRYDWLMSNAKKEWTDWRCQKMNEIYQWTSDRLRKARPDLKLIVYPQAMSFMVPKPNQKLTMSIYDYGRQGGMDLKWLKDNPDIILSMNIQCTARGNRRASVYQDDCLTPFANDGKNGISVRYNWTEMDIDWPKGWGICDGHPRWNHTTCETWMHAPGKYFADYYTNALIRTNPALISQPLSDIALWQGHELDLSRVAQSYYSLPNAKYTRLKEKGRDKNIWIQVAKHDGKIYGYIANPQWWSAQVKLQLASNAEFTDLITGKKIVDKTWKFILAPYSINPFAVANTDNIDVIESCEFTIDENAKKTIMEQLSGYEKVLEDNNLIKNYIKKNPNFKSGCEKLIENCRNALNSEDFDSAWKSMCLTDYGVELFKLNTQRKSPQ